jgi:hypothetical protein
VKRPLPLAIVAVLVAVSLTVGLTAVLAASDSPSNGTSGTVATASSPLGTSGTVATASSPLGTILIDRRGRTLYLFEKDRRGESALLGRMRPGMATAHRPERADRRGERARLAAGHDSKQRRQPTGHLLRASAVSLHG